MPKILIKRGTATQWTSSTTALLPGELGLDTTNNILKVGNGTSLWNSLTAINFTNELAQDAIGLALNHSDHSNIVINYDDTANKIILSSGPDLVTFADLGNSLGDYIPLSYYGNIDGVATLDSSGLIPDAQIPSTIARDSELFSGSYNDLTDKPTIPSLNGYATENYVTTAVSNSTAALVNSAPSTLDTLHEIAAALGNDENYATTITTTLGNKQDKVSGVSDTEIGYLDGVTSAIQTQLNDKLDSSTASSTYLTQTNASSTYAPISSPTFTGTVSGITKTMVGLSNVDNTSDQDKYKNEYVSSTSTSISLSSTTHKFKVLEINSSSAITVTIPNDTQDSDWQIGSSVEVRQVGSGQITIGKDAAVTLNAPENQLKTRVQWSSLFLEKRAANSWLVTGDATA